MGGVGVRGQGVVSIGMEEQMVERQWKRELRKREESIGAAVWGPFVLEITPSLSLSYAEVCEGV